MDSIYDMTYGVNVFEDDKKTSINLYSTASAEVIFLPFPYWEEVDSTAAGSKGADDFGGFFKMAHSATVGSAERWQ